MAESIENTSDAVTEINCATNQPEEITKRDVAIAWLRFYFADEIPHCFDRYIAPALTWALMPILRKLYKSKTDLAAAYQRHLLFFNTQISWGGGTLTGISASLEVARAKEMAAGVDITIDDDLIYNSKAGLMGALSGIGDSIDSGTIQYIFIAIALPWAQAGNPIGALFPFIGFSLYQLVIGWYFANLGFKLGKSAATEIVGTQMQVIIEALSILGLFMMGILAANYVTVASSLSFTLSGKEFVIQDILNTIMPGLLPLLTVGGVYLYFVKKGMNVTKALLGLTLVLGVLAAVGIL
ncbi:PTS system IID component, Man family [Coriobacterium glomerans PW2]|uniref:PTS system IID component, Man family n=1 Tax=Coriobacterium glomerans (strain ATCC 49209 / DSM 20642 / JCM 10262 / PW2) TaxID=700015 RepID=F2N7I5_CORGP|nr:PTS system mannose/fructose/sorbose family transporter subunit IID [Coriobacterium glomerans]AEB06801.1 PTS system IID component, Man family [Coriobacterium glomerans PW2]